MVTFRKSQKIGPFRFTLTPRGVSTSVGVKGARVSVGVDGKIRRTVGLPGTGIYDTKLVGSTSGSGAIGAPRLTSPPDGPDDRRRNRGMTMLDVQAFLNDAAAAGIPADAQPVVEVTMRGRIKRMTLPKR